MATIETNRLELHELLATILGSRNVYFQPPSSIKMKYPAIVYSRSKIDDKNANNSVYVRNICYEIIVIDEDPDTKLIDEILELPKCKFDRSFSSDNLNHNVFTLYY